MAMSEFEIDGGKRLWTDGGAYDATIGRLSGVIAGEFLPWLGVPPQKRWLDVGCGTGALTRAIIAQCDPASIDALDPAEPYLSFAKEHVQDARAHFHLSDVESMDFPADSFDAAVSGLALQFLPDPAEGLRDMISVVAPGGVVGGYMWDFTDPSFALRAFWDTAIALKVRDAQESDPAVLYPLFRPENLQALFDASALQNVSFHRVVCPVWFQNFDEFWSLFVSGQGRGGSLLTGLSEQEHLHLKQAVRRHVGVTKEAAVQLSFIAMAVKGTL